MRSSRGMVCFFLVGTCVLVSVLPGPGVSRARGSEGESKDEAEDIWQDDDGRGSRGWRWYEWSDEFIKRVMDGIKERDPRRAQELEELQKKDENKFRVELRRHGQPEVDKIIREYREMRQRERDKEFFDWLSKNYEKEAENLGKLKKANPRVYYEAFEGAKRRYGYIFDARNNAELMEVLKEDLVLRKKVESLVERIKGEKNDERKKQLAGELGKALSRRFDLIVRRKQIAYERLVRRLEELKERVKRAGEETTRWREPKFKEENVKKRLKDLLESVGDFPWD